MCRVGIGASAMPEGTLDKEICADCPAFPLSFSKQAIYWYKLIHQSKHFDYDDGGSMYLRNTGNVAHKHALSQPRNRINSND
jgi:hypothetical protein